MVTDITDGDVEKMAMEVNRGIARGWAEHGWGDSTMTRIPRDAWHPEFRYTFGDVVLTPPAWSDLKPITPGVGMMAMVAWRYPQARMGCWSIEHLWRMELGDASYELSRSRFMEATDEERWTASLDRRGTWLERGLPFMNWSYFGPEPHQAPPAVLERLRPRSTRALPNGQLLLFGGTG